MDIFQKQPADVLDYDCDYSAFLLASGGDTLASAVTTATTGITVTQTIVSPSTGHVKVWLSGGTNGNTYEINVTATTTGGRVKEANFKVKIKAY